MAAVAGNTQRCVMLCHLLLASVLVFIGADDAAVGAATCCSPPLTTSITQVHEAEKLQGLLRRGSDAQAPAGDGLPAAAPGGVIRKRRMLVGSRAPTCTYNECRGCRHRCSVQEVPIDASDPINSAYHYRCICHL